MRLVYFARVREQVGTPEEEIALPAGLTTVGGLLDHLRTLGENYDWALEDESRIRIAVNEVYVDRGHPLTDRDEVAIFPPMTGG